MRNFKWETKFVVLKVSLLCPPCDTNSAHSLYFANFLYSHSVEKSYTDYIHMGFSLPIESCKMLALVSSEEDASDGEGDPASDPPHEEVNIGDNI